MSDETEETPPPRRRRDDAGAGSKRVVSAFDPADPRLLGAG